MKKPLYITYSLMQKVSQNVKGQNIMIQIVSSINLHDKQYPVYVFVGKELKNTIMVDNPDNLALEIINQYSLYNANKIVLSGNDLLVYHYEKQIREQNATKYHFDNLIIEKIN